MERSGQIGIREAPVSSATPALPFGQGLDQSVEGQGQVELHGRLRLRRRWRGGLWHGRRLAAQPAGSGRRP